jgi:hypothetical protein
VVRFFLIIQLCTNNISPSVLIVSASKIRHLVNFVLLFASNIENLVFFMLGGVVNGAVLHVSELLLAGLYIFLVIKNLLWFVQPLSSEFEQFHLRE